MALDPIGVSTLIPSAQVATGNLQTEPQEQVQQVASQLETGTRTSPVTAQAQVQGALQADQQQQNADAQRQERAARENDRGERIDIEA